MTESLTLLLAIVISLVTAVLDGFIFSSLWSWFVVPNFQAPLLTIWQSTGLILIISFLRIRISINEPFYDVTDLIRYFVLSTCFRLTIFGEAWVFFRFLS